jgi:hypothetical protein
MPARDAWADDKAPARKVSYETFNWRKIFQRRDPPHLKAPLEPLSYFRIAFCFKEVRSGGERNTHPD